MNRDLKEKKGFSLRRVNWGLIIIALMLALTLLISSVHTLRGYWDMQDATEEYISCQQDAADLSASSDYLTEQVRAFVITGDPERVDNFFEEILNTRRRDRALENLERYLAGTESYEYLRSALEYSNELIGREYYAFRLAVEAYGLDVNDFPAELQEVALTPEELSLSAEKQASLARNLVFDSVYQDYKDRINENVSLCMETLIRESRTQQQSSSQRLMGLLQQQYVLITVLLVMVFTMVVLVNRLIISPLSRIIGRIRNQDRLPEKGAYELRYLAMTYNRMFDQTQKHQNMLSYEANHDSLTGLFNRSAFEKFRSGEEMDRSAMILVDLDHFKSINDTYGHDIGDQALKKVAEILQSSFRSEDHVCRIGGDEFAVIMIHADSSLRDLVSAKVRRANEKLNAAEDGLPALSLSVGVAFCDRANATDDIFKDADTALYQVKNNGRNGCAFYGDPIIQSEP